MLATLQGSHILLLLFLCSDNQGGYGSVGRMGMGNSYSGGYGAPDGLGGYGKSLFLYHGSGSVLHLKTWMSPDGRFLLSS